MSPTSMATVRSKMMVRKKVMSSTVTSLFGFFISAKNERHHEHTGKTSHRDVLGERHEEEEDEQEHYGMHDAADRSLAAVVDVGHRTGDGTSGRDAAEDG